jgi:hypothetical protein
MKKSRFIIAACCAMALSALSLSSCSSSDTVEDTPTVTNGNTMVFNVNKGFAADTLTRAAAQPETQRVILPDGLLVDATLTDVGNTAATRATSPTYEDIPDNSKGIALICAAGETTILKVDEFTVSGNKLTIHMPSPNTGSYDIYFYLNEGDGVTTSSTGLTGATAGGDVTQVKFTSRAANSKDDYAKATSVTAASTTVTNDGTYLTFTPLNAELMLEVQAGITPLSGFAMSLSGIHAASMENLYLYNGNFTGTGTATDIALNNDCYGTDADKQYPTDQTLRPVKWYKGQIQTGEDEDTEEPIYTDNDYSWYSGALYGDTLWSHGGYQRFVQLDPATNKQATLHITSISGPNGTDANASKPYGIDIKFKTTTYQNGHSYKLILQLATPINGYEEVNTTTGVGTGNVLADVAGTACNTGIVDATYTPEIKPTFGASATWPALCGRPQYYEWDAKAYYPNTGDEPSSTVAPNSFKNQNEEDAKYSCAKCPNYNEMTWYVKGGTYWDSGRWYCPNGFLACYDSSTKNNNDIVVHTGGRWFKKSTAIDGFTSTSAATTTEATTLQVGKPGVVRLISNDANHQTVNNWFFLPAAGDYCHKYIYMVGKLGAYTSRTHISTGSMYYLYFTNVKAEAGRYSFQRFYGLCLWSVQ